MAAIIKKQILKHLSKFAKNLSAESINLSTLKGEGEVYNLDFDCIAIQNLLNLPTWLKINHASCNKVTVKIPWTKTSTSPVTIILDSVDVTMSTCDSPREPNGPSPIQDSASGGENSYGSIQRILEGIALRIDSISVQFTSTVFTAAFQLSQLVVYSTDPSGNNADLRMTRIINKQLKQVLTFKKIWWQTMRIEVQCGDDDDSSGGGGGGNVTTARLITNNIFLFVTLRRKTSDLSLLASRIHIKFDDLQWIFTVEQLQAAMLCVKSLNDIIEKSLDQTKLLNKSNPPATNTTTTTTSSATSSTSYNMKGNEAFHKHLIHESSFHFDLDKINLVIADDGKLFEYHQKKGCSPIVEGGALLVGLSHLSIDHYPSHQAGGSRRHFRCYDESMEARDKWADEIITRFTHDYIRLKKDAKLKGVKMPPSGSKLMESCSVVRLGDIDVEQVTSSSTSTSCKKSEGDALSEAKLMTSQRNSLHLPEEMKFFSLHLTNYFYPDNRDYPAPHQNIFLRVNAPVLLLDWKSLAWINVLMLSTLHSVQQVLRHMGLHADDVITIEESEHVDVRMETLMPKIIIPSPDPLKEEIEKSENYKKQDFPDGLEIHISELCVTNCRSGRNSSLHYLHSVLNSFQQTFLKKSSSFPHKAEDETRHVSYELLRHRDVTHPMMTTNQQQTPLINGKSLKRTKFDDVWSLWIRQMWVDVVRCCPDDDVTSNLQLLRHHRRHRRHGDDKKKKKNLTNHQIVDSFPLTAWTSLAFVDDYDDVTSSKNDVTSSKNDDVTGSSGKFVGDGDGDVTGREERRKKLMRYYGDDDDENRPLEGAAETENKKAEKDKETKKKKIADISVLVHSDKTLKLKIDHFEFVYLQRLIENVQKITQAITDDVTIILGDDVDETGAEMKMRIGLKLLVPEVKLFIVLNEIDNESDENEKISQASSFNSLSQALGDRFGTPSYQQPHNNNKLACDDDNNSDVISIFGDASHTSYHHQPTRSFTFPSSNPAEQQPTTTTSERAHTPSSGRKISSLWRTRGEKLFGKPQHLRTSSLYQQQTRSPACSVCDDASSTDDVTLHHHNSDDVTSVNSFEQFVVLDLDEEERNSISSHNSGGGQHDENHKTKNEKSATDEAARSSSSEITSSPSPSSHDDVMMTMRDSVTTVTSSSSPTRHHRHDEEKMSLVCVEVDENVEMFLDLNEELSSNIKLVLHRVRVNQLGNFNKNSNVFTSQSISKKLEEVSTAKKKDEKSKTSLQKAQVRMRIEERNKKQTIKIKAENIQQNLFTSTLNNLGVFMEDERLVESAPMLEVEGCNIELSIHDDMKGQHVRNIVGCKPPVNINVQHVHLHTDQQGTFVINSLRTDDVEAKTENRRQLGSTSRVSDVTSTTSSSSTSSRNQLEEELVLVKHERDSLYAAIKMMQDDLMKSENERSRIHQKLLILQQQNQQN